MNPEKRMPMSPRIFAILATAALGAAQPMRWTQR